MPTFGVNAADDNDIFQSEDLADNANYLMQLVGQNHPLKHRQASGSSSAPPSVCDPNEAGWSLSDFGVDGDGDIGDSLRQ
eukprot:scaffold562833_cov36-Prasinocladus_malaysianus.AAC.1